SPRLLRLRHRVARDVFARLAAEALAARGFDTHQFLVERRPETVQAELAHEVLHARPAAVLALTQPVPDAHDRFRNDQHVFRWDEVAQRYTEVGLRAETAGDVDREALDTFAVLGAYVGVEPEVVDGSLGAVAFAVAERDLE